MKTYFYLYKLTKKGRKKYLCRNGVWKESISHLTYKSLKKQNALAVREFIEGAINECLYLDEL